MARTRRDRDKDWCKQYHAVIDYAWGYLSPTAQAIYPVLDRFADYYHRCTGVSQSWIGKVARRRKPIRQEKVSRAISELESWGLVVKRWTERGLVYYLPRKKEILAFLVEQRGLQLTESELALSESDLPPADFTELQAGLK